MGQTIWLRQFALDIEEEEIYICELEKRGVFRTRRTSRYIKVPYAELPQLIHELKEIWASRSSIIGVEE